MPRFIRPVLALAVLGLIAPSGEGHYNMLLLQTASGKRGEPVTVRYQWGHPFEHQLFDAPAPQEVFALAPDGKRTDLDKMLESISEQSSDQQKVRAYQFRFTPEQRGDFLLVLNTPPIWMAEDQEFFQDNVKVVLHVQAQNGWDRAAGQDFEVVPLTRPYGLEAGTVFQAQVLTGDKALAGGLVEIEHYHPAAPKELPPDEQITRTAKTDPNGVVTCTLGEPGWWCITAQRDAGKKGHDGHAYPVRRRAIFWVFVDEKVAARPAP